MCVYGYAYSLYMCMWREREREKQRLGKRKGRGQGRDEGEVILCILNDSGKRETQILEEYPNVVTMNYTHLSV